MTTPTMRQKPAVRIFEGAPYSKLSASAVQNSTKWGEQQNRGRASKKVLPSAISGC
jgi:hypothetical protein